MKNKTVNIRWTINLPMEVPEDWDTDLINFHFNESSWCCDNLIDILKEYSDKYGCICNICEGVVV